MRLVSFTIEDRLRLGAVVGDGADERAVDLTGRIDGVEDLSDALAGERLEDVRVALEAAREAPPLRLADLDLAPAVPRPGRIFCIGVNYGGRNAEYRDGSAEASYPSVFVRFPSSLTGHEQAVIRPPESEQLDYEGEIVAVIGRGGRRIPVASARAHLAGLTLGNEGTVRDWVAHAKFNVTQGKNWDRSGAMGPWLVTMDEIGDLDDLHLTTTVNGDVRQDDTTATMRHPIEELVAYLSTFCTLAPGDVIFTGTPTGAGARFDPPRWLVPGDVVEVTVPGIGTLRNHVEDEA